MRGKMRVLLVLCGLPLLTPHGYAAEPKADATDHRLAIQVNSDNVDTMNMAIGNAMAVKRYYDAHHQRVQIEIVAYGPGITMLRDDTSPVKDNLALLEKAAPDVVLSMCGNAKAATEKREGHAITPLPAARVVPSGAVRLMELQEQGWSYIRP